MLYQHCRRVIRHVTDEGGAIITPPLPEGVPPWDRKAVDFKIYGHNVTLPNELAARSLGLDGVQRLRLDLTDDQCLDRAAALGVLIDCSVQVFGLSLYAR
jgi:hypothetical protein